MRGSVFAETLRREWRNMIFWGVGIGMIGLVVLLIIPSVDALNQMVRLIETLPPAILQAAGMQDVSQIATPEGFLGGAYFGRVILFLCVYAVISGLNMTSSEEDAGIMDVLLSQPLPRWRIVVEKFAAYALMSVVIVVMGFLGLFIGAESSSLDINIGRLAEGNLNVLPSVLLAMAFTLFAGVFFRTRTLAIAASAVFVVGSYFLNFIGGLASGSVVDQLRVVSFFRYYNNEAVMQNGLAWGDIGLLLGLTALLFAASLWFFQRRDIGL